MNEPIKRMPFFSIVLPGTESHTVCLYEEGARTGTGPHLSFDVVSSGGSTGVGTHDLSTGTIHLFLDDDVESVVPDSTIAWTGICVGVEEKGLGVSPFEDSFQDGWIVLYAGWFDTTPRASWAAEMRISADGTDAEPIEIDEDEAYEQMCDPERRAVALAYAA